MTNEPGKADAGDGGQSVQDVPSHERSRGLYLWPLLLFGLIALLTYDLRPYLLKGYRHRQTEKLLPIGISAADATARLVDNGYGVPAGLSLPTSSTVTLVHQYRQKSVIGFLGSCMGMWPMFKPGYEDIGFDSSGCVNRIIFCD